MSFQEFVRFAWHSCCPSSYHLSSPLAMTGQSSFVIFTGARPVSVIVRYGFSFGIALLLFARYCRRAPVRILCAGLPTGPRYHPRGLAYPRADEGEGRSEERRVGEECRSR